MPKFAVPMASSPAARLAGAVRAQEKSYASGAPSENNIFGAQASSFLMAACI
jgi:hypothetical protein